MDTQDTELLEKIKGAVERAIGRELDTQEPSASLGLDSISRITLIVELENTFQMAIDTETMQPEDFDSLTTLSQLMSQLMANQQ